MRKILILFLVFGLVMGCVGVVSAEGANTTTATTTETTTTATTTETTTAATTTETTTVPKTDLDVSIKVNVISGKVPLTVKFTAVVVNDSLVESYIWEVHKDENYKKGKSVEYTYKEVGEYTVTLIVNPVDTTKYNKVEKTVKITAEEDVLYATFTSSTTSGTAPLAVKFTDASSGATSWGWSIYKTDGGSRTLQKEMTDRNTTYTFQNPGTYQVELIAKKGSNTSSEVKTITVSAKATTATTVATTKTTTAPTTAATTSPAAKAVALSSDDDLVPNPISIIEEFIHLLKVMLVPENYNLDI